MNNYLWLIPIIVTFISIFICIIKKKKIEKEYKLELEKELEQYKEKEYQSIHKQIEEERNRYEYELNVLKQSIKSEESKRDSIIQREKEIVDSSVRLYRTQKFNEVDWEKAQALTKLFDEIAQKKTEEQNKLQKILEEINKEKEISQSEIQKIQEELKEYQSKRDAINQEILREKQLQDEQSCHRIILSQSDKDDINYLISIIDNIKHKDILYKLIWSEYLIKPFNEMIKKQFGSKVPSCVIYCIETLDGKIKYIGKTQSDVSKRWTEHIKTSLNIGGVSRSKIHDSLFMHWDEFVFSVLEETSKDKLSEREKYYINFFESDKYGFNIKSGG